jgi:FkbM family methyltransferase
MNIVKDFEPKRNIRTFDRLVCELRRIYDIPRWDLRYMCTFKNFRQMYFACKSKNFPTTAIMRNGKIIKVNDEFHVFLLLFWTLDESEVIDDLIIIRKKGREEIKLHGWKKGDVKGVFMLEDYSALDVTDKDVLDVGANIGDTAIYFLRRGAARIIGLEPSEENFSIAIKNIRENRLESKVTLLNYAIGDIDGKKLVTERGKGGIYNITEEMGSREMTFVTLASLVKQFELNDAILKVDCEGAEYDALLSTERDVLRKFQEILIEYHYGYINLKKKLESCGFKVSVSRPEFSRQPLFANPDIIFGYILAKRID